MARQLRFVKTFLRSVTKADVCLPRAHGHVLESNQLKVVNGDVTTSNPEAVVRIILHRLAFHIL